MKKVHKDTRSALIRPHRPPRATPRQGYPAGSWQADTDAAPEWAWRTVDAVLAHTNGLPDYGYSLGFRILKWVGHPAGDSDRRALQIMTLLHLWIGDRLPMLESFVKNVEKTKAGRKRRQRAADLARNEIHIIRLWLERERPLAAKDFETWLRETPVDYLTAAFNAGREAEAVMRGPEVRNGFGDRPKIGSLYQNLGESQMIDVIFKLVGREP